MLTYDPSLDAYAVLGVEVDASQEAVEAAFREAARMWHPDKTRAPDAAARFIEVQEAGKVLRDPGLRQRYTRLREMHLGPSSRARSRRKAPEPTPHAPLADPPEWLRERARVHRDAVLMTVDQASPVPRAARLATLLAYTVLVLGVASSKLMFGALAIVLFGIGMALKIPPNRSLLAWAKLVPARRIAEYHAYEQATQSYARLEVPYERIFVQVVATARAFQVELRGFPRVSLPVLYRTQDHAMAHKCAREVARWLQLPMQAAA